MFVVQENLESVFSTSDRAVSRLAAYGRIVHLGLVRTVQPSSLLRPLQKRVWFIVRIYQPIV